MQNKVSNHLWKFIKVSLDAQQEIYCCSGIGFLYSFMVTLINISQFLGNLK